MFSKWRTSTMYKRAKPNVADISPSISSAMTETLVFIFLLDHLPGNGLNQTFETVNITQTTPPQNMKCDAKITDPLLQVISRKLGAQVVSEWLNEDNNYILHSNANANFGLKIMDSTKTNEVTNSSAEMINSKEITDENIDQLAKNEVSSSNAEMTNSTENLDDDSALALLNEIVNDGAEIQEMTMKMPENPPMLVAIFETVSNVTAQTCAGTLLAPNWVLTAASCVNLLSNASRNLINSTEESTYTIVVNATDPLVDGTAHNVTHVFEYPVHDHNKRDEITDVPNVTENPERNAMETVISNATNDVNNIEMKRNKRHVLTISNITENEQTESTIQLKAAVPEKPSNDVTDMTNKNVIQIKSNVTETAQNVTKIVQQSNETNIISNTEDLLNYFNEIEDSSENSDSDNNMVNPSIVLMRIHPPVAMENVNIVSQTDGANVIVYGWVIKESESGHERMHKVALEVQTLSPSACALRYNVTQPVADYELCLALVSPFLAFPGQMSWGGPVAAPSGGLLAVSRGDGDGSAPLTATPLAQYSDWIYSVISTHSNST